MRTVDIIQKKRDGLEHSTEEIQFLIEGYTNQSIPDYQLSAWMMAIYFQGMTAKETADLTMAMAHSGDVVDLSSIDGIKVDKHSTGGVGDTTTIVLAPLAAAAGIPVAKMSGRGLGHTGGTIDKFESIAGFSVELTKEQFTQQVNQIGVCVIGQSGNITPADKLLYALRDVTATVDSIPLIASSIMSKKIAAGANAIVLDVKTGKGAFMKSLDESIELAKAMVEIGEQVGRETTAIVSNMDQPLGLAVGNALEVEEAIRTLSGNGPADLEELCLELGAHMLLVGKQAGHYDEARDTLKQLLHNGQALEKFKQFAIAQGGDVSLIEHPKKLPQAMHVIEVTAQTAGYVSEIEAEAIGLAAMLLGAGRETKQSQIDPSVGIMLRKKVSDEVLAGEVIAELHVHGSVDKWNAIVERVQSAYTIISQPVTHKPLIYAVVTKNGVKRIESSI